MKNTFYAIAFILSAFIGYSCSSTGSASTETENAQFGEIKTLVAGDFNAKEKDSNTVVIDVRSPEEVANGFIPGTDLFINFLIKDHLFKFNKTFLINNNYYIKKYSIN
jgi:hypothetical protein